MVYTYTWHHHPLSLACVIISCFYIQHCITLLYFADYWVFCIAGLMYYSWHIVWLADWPERCYREVNRFWPRRSNHCHQVQLRAVSSIYYTVQIRRSCKFPLQFSSCCSIPKNSVSDVKLIKCQKLVIRLPSWWKIFIFDRLWQNSMLYPVYCSAVVFEGYNSHSVESRLRLHLNDEVLCMLNKFDNW